MKTPISSAAEPDGWTLQEWTKAAKIALPTFYTIPEELRPAHTRIGRRVVVTEAPRAWLERMAALGPVRTRTAQAA